jgi:hypothetical protein
MPPMRKIRAVLRLHLKGRLSRRQIAAALGISKGVAANYISLATQLVLGRNDMAPMSFVPTSRGRLPDTIHPITLHASVRNDS